MAKVTEYVPGELLVLGGSDYGLRIDRSEGLLTLVRHRLIGRSREKLYPLDRLVELRLRCDETPAITLATVGKLLGVAFDAARSGQVPPDALRSFEGSPRRVLLRLGVKNAAGEVSVTEEQIQVEGLDTDLERVEFALRVASAAGLVESLVASLPSCGTQVQLVRGPSGSGGSESAQELLEEAALPPFDPSDFRGDFRVEEWSPGRCVRFRKPLSRAVPFVVPFTFLVFAGPALFWATRDQPSSDTLALIGFGGIFGLVIGVVAIVALARLLPRTVELDWSRREILISNWRGKVAIPFSEVARLELEAEKHVSSGGEGSDRTSFDATLRAVKHARGEQPGKQEIVQTCRLERIQEPLWMGLPLLYDLAAALEVEGRFLDYEFRRGGAS